jgi:hypothetical protein
MTVDDWIIVFTLLKDPLAGLNTEIAGLNTDLSASLISIASSISTLTTTLNSLGVVALQLIFLFVFVWLAYWRRTWELYLVAAILSVLVGWQLMGILPGLYMVFSPLLWDCLPWSAC